MNIESKMKKETICIKIDGRIDSNTAPELEKYISENIGDAKAAELDFKKVEYISSAGLRVMLSLQKRVSKEEGHVIIKHMNDTVKAVFELTGFADMFIIK